jgi:hypothetical protein
MCGGGGGGDSDPPAKAQPIVNRRPSRLQLGTAARNTLAGQGSGVDRLTNAGGSRSLNLRTTALGNDEAANAFSVGGIAEYDAGMNNVRELKSLGGVIGRSIARGAEARGGKGSKRFAESKLRIMPSTDAEGSQ